MYKDFKKLDKKLDIFINIEKKRALTDIEKKQFFELKLEWNFLISKQEILAKNVFNRKLPYNI